MVFPQGGAIQYSGDPLQDFTLIRFLDRFVFRNPKQQKGKREYQSHDGRRRDGDRTPTSRMSEYVCVSCVPQKRTLRP